MNPDRSKASWWLLTTVVVTACANRSTRTDSAPRLDVSSQAGSAVGSASSPVHATPPPEDAAAADGSPDIGSTPASAGTFPPAPFVVAAEAAKRRFVLGSRGLEGWVAAAPKTGDATLNAALIHFDSKNCEVAEKAAVAGLPSFGAIDLNREPDKIFGVVTASAATAVVVPAGVQPGHRWIEGMGGDATGPQWMLLGRGPDPSTAVSDLYRWESGKWKAASGSTLDHDWFLPRPFGGPRGVLLLERDILREAAWPKVRPIRFRAFGATATPPALPPRADDAKCGSRVTEVLTFDNGDVVTLGATCSNELLLERWAAGSSTPKEQVFANIATDSKKAGVLEPTNKSALYVRGLAGGFTARPVGTNQIEVRDQAKKSFRLTFDGSLWSASPLAESAEEHVEKLFAPFAKEFRLDEVVVAPAGTWVLGLRLADQWRLLLRDKTSGGPCRLPN